MSRKLKASGVNHEEHRQDGQNLFDTPDMPRMSCIHFQAPEWQLGGHEQAPSEPTSRAGNNVRETYSFTGQSRVLILRASLREREIRSVKRGGVLSGPGHQDHDGTPDR